MRGEFARVLLLCPQYAVPGISPGTEECGLMPRASELSLMLLCVISIPSNYYWLIIFR